MKNTPILLPSGNEQVVGAKFEDADFFIREDNKQKLEDMLPALENTDIPI